jgi:LytS/YehU family sensor histidine kinase
MNLSVDFNIDQIYNNHRLPPLAIQTLVENAVKHNEISKRNPLAINIRTTANSTLLISNTIHEKISLEPGTGIGLANLSKQFRLLGAEDVRITRVNNEFNVEIPLLKPLVYEGGNS